MSLRIHRPSSDDQVLDIVSDAVALGRTLRIVGGGSKRSLRRAVEAAAALDLSGLSGITDYDPDELVLTARAGTTLAEIEPVLDARRQMLAFDPFDHALLLGGAPGRATLGGVIAANVSGSRRLAAGAARDHVLGFSGVTGRGERMKGGGAVVKNVTGFDLPKLMAGSWGTLAVMTSVTVRVLPKPRTEQTVLFRGLPDRDAHRLMNEAVSSGAAVSCAAHWPATQGAEAAGQAGASQESRTLLRLEGFGPSVDVRCRELLRRLRPFGTGELQTAETSSALWAAVRGLEGLPSEDGLLWRVSVPPSRGWQVRERLAIAAGRYLYDWGGAQVWAALPAAADGAAAATAAARVTAVARELGGHASLIRAPHALRAAGGASAFMAGSSASVPGSSGAVSGASDSAPGATGSVPGGLEAVRLRIKQAFDPHGILNPGVDPGAEY